MKLLQICAVTWLWSASAVEMNHMNLADALNGNYAESVPYLRKLEGFTEIQLTNPSPLHPMGHTNNEQQAGHSKKVVPSIVNFAAKLTSKEQTNVCERTKKALFVAGEAPAQTDVGDPVYEECMSVMEPFLREHNPKTKSTDVLNGCARLIDDLTTNSRAGTDTKDLCNLLVEQLNPTTAPKPRSAVKLPPKAAVGGVNPNALTTLCELTVKSALKNVKTEADALQLGGTVAPLCQNFAKEKLLRNATAVPANLQDWCYELDGRLTVAIETGYLFALHPTQALQQANEVNPYAQMTRKGFCGRFAKAVQHEKFATKPLPTITRPTPAALRKSTPAALRKTTSAGVPNATSQKVAAALEPVAPVRPAAPVTTPKRTVQSKNPKASKSAASVDMLGLMQQLSQQPQWTSLCSSLLGRLTSEEGAVTEELSIGREETKAANLVLTFNAEDQAEIGKCATSLKVLAIQSKILGMQSPAEGQHPTAFLSIAERAESELQNTETMAALIDSPWARDACTDIAQGFLVAHLAHPDLEKESFCEIYAKDLNRMRSVVATEAPMQPAQPLPVAKVDTAAVADEASKRKAAEKVDTAAVAGDAAKRKAAEKAQALKQLRRRQAAEFAAKAKAAEEKKKTEQYRKQKAELVDAQHSGSMFLKDMIVANATNADAAEFELQHPDGDDPRSQFTQPASKKQALVQPVDAKPPPHVKEPASKKQAPVQLVDAKPPPHNLTTVATKGKSLPVSKLPATKAASPAKAAPMAPVSNAKGDVASAAPNGNDDDDEGAAFWKEMFQR